MSHNVNIFNIFKHAFTVLCCIFEVISLLWTRQQNYFDNENHALNACWNSVSHRALKGQWITRNNCLRRPDLPFHSQSIEKPFSFLMLNLVIRCIPFSGLVISRCSKWINNIWIDNPFFLSFRLHSSLSHFFIGDVKIALIFKALTITSNEGMSKTSIFAIVFNCLYWVNPWIRI